MNQDDFLRIETLFQEAADRPAAEREEYLARACADRPDLRQRVHLMLERLERGDSLDPPPLDSLPATEGEGSVIGRYKLLQVVGEGGFGTVYMAEQLEPVQRKVALKVIKPGMDTREVVARFEAERQALAMMDHVHIARVLDGGATDTGRPYFVMELVRGIAITEYCDQNQLSTRERLELFLPVCQAIQHAHQKGVIHRDLKPSNVMVTLLDGQPVPKVIDFGIAKAMTTRLTDKTLFTRYQQFVGTPAYMSPEQAEMSALDVDTRSDIYSLGVLLYELLTGTTPFDTRRLWQAGFAEVQRVIREESPQKPSQRISTTADASIAQRRRLDVKELCRTIRGDLDWIVMKALEKERGRRYGTASDLAADLSRHLQDEPVEAGPPSSLYRLRKLLVRRRAAVISIALVLLTLIGGLIGTGLGLLESSRQRHNAERRQAGLQNVTDFLVDTLALADPAIAMDPSLSVRTLLERVARQVEDAFPDEPEAEARVRGTLGRAWLNLSEHELAHRQLLRAAELMDTLPDFDRGEHYKTLWALTEVSFYMEEETAFSWASKSRQVAHDFIRQSHPRVADRMDAFHHEVERNAHVFEGEPMIEVRRLYRLALEAIEQDLRPGDPIWKPLAESFQSAGYWVWYGPHEADGVVFFEQALAIQSRELPVGHPDANESLNVLVDILGRQGRAAEARERIEQNVARMRQSFPEDSFQLALAESSLGQNLCDLGEYEQAEQLLLRSHAVIIRSTKRPEAFYAVDSYVRVVGLYDRWGRPEQAAPYREQIVQLMVRGRTMYHWTVARCTFTAELEPLRDALDGVAERVGGLSLAVTPGTANPPDLDEWVARARQARAEWMDPSDPRDCLIGRLLVLWCNTLDPACPARAVLAAEARSALDAWQDTVPLDHADCLAMLAEAAFDQGDADAARRHLGAALESLARFTLEDNWYSATTKVRIARALLRGGLYAEAEELLRVSEPVIHDQLGPTHRDHLLTVELLDTLHRHWQRPGGGTDG